MYKNTIVLFLILIFSQILWAADQTPANIAFANRILVAQKYGTLLNGLIDMFDKKGKPISKSVRDELYRKYTSATAKNVVNMYSAADLEKFAKIMESSEGKMIIDFNSRFFSEAHLKSGEALQMEMIQIKAKN